MIRLVELLTNDFPEWLRRRRCRLIGHRPSPNIRNEARRVCERCWEPL